MEKNSLIVNSTKVEIDSQPLEGDVVKKHILDVTLPSWLWSVPSEGISLHHWLKVREERSWAATLLLVLDHDCTHSGCWVKLWAPMKPPVKQNEDDFLENREEGFHNDFPPQHYIVVSLLLLYISCSFPPCLLSDPFTFISCFLSICHIFRCLVSQL